MKSSIQQHLLELNRTFYQTQAESFSGTRYGPQPGWHRLLPYFPQQGAVLDLGCGNGRLALFLNEHLEDIHYVGLEGSPALIAIAQKATQDLEHVRVICHQVDLTTSAWHESLGQFDVVTALAVLHHIPGHETRAAFLRQARACLHPQGILILSTWRFTHQPRMRRKILPWSTIGLSETDVEPGDYLLDWKKGEGGLRYVHQLDEYEIAQLAHQAGLEVVEQFRADGREGDLSLYTVLRHPT